MRLYSIVFMLVALLFSGLFFTGCASKKKSVCKVERHTSTARQKSTMRVYKVHGKCYTPTYVEVGQTMQGISSWYGPNFHGKYTSNGEHYNMHARTAAHKTWPMDTIVRVKNIQNGKSTIVRINDRGPFIKGRIIDCSYLAGKEIGLDKAGLAKVELEVLGFSGNIVSNGKANKKKQTTHKARVRLTNFGVQVGAFRNHQGAVLYRKRYAHRYPQYKTVIKKFTTRNGLPLYRVWLMGFDAEEEAKDFKNSHHLKGAFIVRN